MSTEIFSEHVKKLLRNCGKQQQELAKEIALDPKVLSRKIRGYATARLTQQEVRCIIRVLARWHAISSKDEAIELLREAGMDASHFSDDEWHSPPLNTLTKKTPAAAPITTPVSPAPQPRQHNLPYQTTRLIGRDWAVSRLHQMLSREDVRLVTLVGAGGSGKTRLALAVARELMEGFEQGIWLVLLAGVSEAELVPVSILQTLNIQSAPDSQPLQSLINYLQNKRLLLILDNFEQLEEATPIIGELLESAPGLKVLLTSRVALHLYGEREFSVPPLDIPALSAEPGSIEFKRFGAIQLFVERAQAVMPDFTLTSENEETIGQICARLDGLPLALELAAARTRVLPPKLLLERLIQARLPLLVGGARNLPNRQQTLRNTIMWSYNLLSPTKQQRFCHLGVFSGGWSLEAAETLVAGIPLEEGALSGAGQSTRQGAGWGAERGTALDTLEQLVDNSLIARVLVDDEQTRFTMLETLREYALEELTKHSELERLRDWHARYYLRKAETAERELRGPHQLEWLARMTIDRDNLRAALDWSLHKARNGLKISATLRPGRSLASEVVAGSWVLSTQGEGRGTLPASEVALRLAAALRPYWEWQGHLTEARYWLTATLEATRLQVPAAREDGKTLQAARAKALSEASRLSSLENNQVKAIELIEESIRLWQQLNDSAGLASALLHRVWAAHATSDYEAAKKFCEQGLGYLAGRDDAWLRGQLLMYFAAAEGFTGNFQQMRVFYLQSQELFEHVGDRSSVADVVKDHGAMRMLEGKFTEAIELLLQSVGLSEQLGQKQFLTTGLCWLSIGVGMRSEPNPEQASIDAAQLRGAADKLMEMSGFTSWAKTNAFVVAVEEYIRLRIGDERWNEALNKGRKLTLAQAIELARTPERG